MYIIIIIITEGSGSVESVPVLRSVGGVESVPVLRSVGGVESVPVLRSVVVLSECLY